MALETVFEDARLRLRALHEALSSLRTTIVEDKPLQGDVVLVDVFGDAADDLLGLLEEALVAAVEAQQAASAPADLATVRRALVRCQERFNQISARLSFDLLPYERIAELLRFGRTRGGEWRVWAASVKDALDWCRQPVFDVNEALFGCWRELTEQAGAGALNVQTTTIGQHLLLARGRSGALEEAH
jgi:hypothetical protein